MNRSDDKEQADAARADAEYALRWYDFNKVLERFPEGSEGRLALRVLLNHLSVNGVAGFMDKATGRVVTYFKDYPPSWPLNYEDERVVVIRDNVWSLLVGTGEPEE